ncbi:MAG: recombinase family protein [Synergistaceae bacterium]|jgi:DNA invertase Pin-like site-specific DNA recombinase|nr:recombinase family protein [Synergistaceae bacterium]
MKIGYARISNREQNAGLQYYALREAGCEKIYTDTASGVKSARPELDRMLSEARQGDVIVIWKLDRLGRSLKHLVELVSSLYERGIGLRSLNDPIDTTTAQMRLVFGIFGSLAEFERELVLERTQAGLSAARARGRVGGRPKGLSDTAEATAIMAETLYKERKLSVVQMCEKLDISKNTFYRYLRHRGVELGSVSEDVGHLRETDPHSGDIDSRVESASARFNRQLSTPDEKQGVKNTRDSVISDVDMAEAKQTAGSVTSAIQASHAEEVPLELKRKRGRPKRVEPIQALDAEEVPSELKRKRGRPKRAEPIQALDAEEVPLELKRKRGRPKRAEPIQALDAEELPLELKRKRGRPKKVEPIQALDAEEVPLELKRKRGRPKKVEPIQASHAEESPLELKRKRGRPKKVTPAQDIGLNVDLASGAKTSGHRKNFIS